MKFTTFFILCSTKGVKYTHVYTDDKVIYRFFLGYRRTDFVTDNEFCELTMSEIILLTDIFSVE